MDLPYAAGVINNSAETVRCHEASVAEIMETVGWHNLWQDIERFRHDLHVI